MNTETKKACSSCKELKTAAEYSKDSSAKDGMQSACKACKAEYAKQPEAKAKMVEQQLQRRYGVSLDWYDETLEAQGGGCGICGTTEPRGKGGKNGTFCVDHDHETNEVRGLLCFSCNAALGSFKDNPAILQAAADYLIEHKGKKQHD